MLPRSFVSEVLPRDEPILTYDSDAFWETTQARTGTSHEDLIVTDGQGLEWLDFGSLRVRLD